MNALLLAICSLLPHDPVVRDECCIIEANKLPGGNVQYVFWGFDGHIIDWRYVETGQGIQQGGDGYATFWHDRGHVMRLVSGEHYLETAGFDSEQEQRNLEPSVKRKGLTERGKNPFRSIGR